MIIPRRLVGVQASLRWIYLGDELVPAMREGSNGESEIELPMDAQLVKLLVRELHITPTISATLMLPDDSIVMTVQPLGLPARTIVYNTYDTLNFAALSRIKLSSISTALDYGYPLLARSRNSRFGALLGSLVREEECITLTFSAGALQPKTVSLLSSMGYDADDVFLVGRPSNEGLLLKGLINCRTTCGSFIADADTIAPEEATCDDGAVSLQSIPSDPLGDRTFFGVLRPSTTSHTSSS